MDFCDSFYLNFIKDDRWRYLWDGFWTTIGISFAAVLLGVLLGFTVAVIRSTHDKTGKLRLLNWLCKLYLTVIRGTPVVVQLLIIYFVIFGSVNISKILVAIVAFGVNSGAYVAEIIRGGIVSVDKGQFEAAHAIGMTHWQTMTTVVLPQAIRNILPSVGNELIVNIKDSSVLNVISVSELFFQAKSAAGTYYRYFEVYFIIAVIYLILTLSVSAILRAVEKKMDGPDTYVIHGSQSDSRADIKVSVENEKEAVKRWNV